jgi:PDZ domain
MSSKAPGRSIGILLGVLALLFIPFDRSRRASAAEELGTVGIAAVQLYTDAQPNKRGVLMVRRVEPGSAAGDAGIRLGDIIISVNGSAIEGRDSSQIAQNDFRGPVGGAVRMKIARLDGSQSEIMLTRKPFPPHINPASDPFKYVVPGSWGMDLRYKFPLPWSPAISHQGLEDLAFAPNFADQSSPDYHSYLILWWLDGAPQITAEQLQTDMVVYFRGLAEQRGRNNHFVPDLSKISAEYNEAGQKPQTLGGMPARVFRGAVTIYDTHGSVIKLHSEVTTSVCSSTNHAAVFFGMSREPRPAGIWPQLDAARDSFQCSR